MPIGIQLFTVAKPLAHDVHRTLQQLRRIGFTEVETAGFAGRDAHRFREALSAAGLACPSAHLRFDPGHLGPTFEDAHALGVQYATSSILRLGTGPLPDLALDPKHIASQPGHLPPLRSMTLDDARRTAELANRIGEEARRAGCTYAYHNHYFEFTDLGDDTTAYDVLLRETDARLVKFEIDCGWMIVAGHDPIRYFERHPGRFPMIHAKDFVPLAAGEADVPSRAFMRLGTELGRGFIDYRPIIAAGRRAGLQHIFAEQEGPFDRMTQLEAAAVAYEYLRTAGA